MSSASVDVDDDRVATRSEGAWRLPQAFILVTERPGAHRIGDRDGRSGESLGLRALEVDRGRRAARDPPAAGQRRIELESAVLALARGRDDAPAPCAFAIVERERNAGLGHPL